MSETSEASFERCCRLCAEEQDVTIMIFSHEAEAMLLKNKLNRYLLIEVEKDDKLPKNICIQCCAKLQTVCDFIDTARKAQEVLLNRSIMLDQVIPNECMISLSKNNMNSESESEKNFDSDKYTEMEICVDPMMVLQNSEETLSPTYDHGSCLEDVTYLHGLHTENVTIKLIKREEKPDDEETKVIISPVSNGTIYEDEKDNSSVTPFKCGMCSQSFCTEVDLSSHMLAHMKENYQQTGLCQLCGRIFKSEKTYIAHMSVHLSANKSFTCNICGRSYDTEGRLKIHSVTHSNERPYQCLHCKKTFKRNQDLKFHTNQHTGEKPYKCPFCNKCFASSGNCYSHRSRMHPGKQPESQVIRQWNPPSKEDILLRPIAPKPTNIVSINGIIKYQCHLCDHSFLKKENYNYHMYQHTGEKPFQCTFCSQKFMTRRGLLIHHDYKHPSKDRPLALISKNILLK